MPLTGRRAFFTCLLLLALFALIGGLRLDSSIAWGDDWAQYMMQGQALTEGRPYFDIGYIYSPFSPFYGPPSYPPGTAVVLAAAFAIFGFSLVAAKLGMLLCCLAFLFFFFEFASISYGPGIALAVTAVLAVHPVYVSLSNTIGSEQTYLATSFLALWLIGARDRQQDTARMLVLSLAIGIAIFASYATRQAGIVLLVAVVFCDVLKGRRLLLCTAPVALVFFSGYFALNAWAAGETTSFDTVVYRGMGSQIPALAFSVVNSLRNFSYLPGRADIPVALLLISLAALGVWLDLREPVRQLRLGTQSLGRSMIAAGRFIPDHLLYVLGSVGLIVLLPFGAGLRYLIPIVPIIFLYACAGLVTATSPLRRQNLALFGVFIAIVAYSCLLISTAGGVSGVGSDAPTTDSSRRFFAAVASRAAADDVVAFAKPRAMALMAGRKVVGWPQEANPELQRQFLDSARPAFGAITRDLRFQGESPALKRSLEQQGSLVYEDPYYLLYRLRPTP